MSCITAVYRTRMTLLSLPVTCRPSCMTSMTRSDLDGGGEWGTVLVVCTGGGGPLRSHLQSPNEEICLDSQQLMPSPVYHNSALLTKSSPSSESYVKSDTRSTSFPTLWLHEQEKHLPRELQLQQQQTDSQMCADDQIQRKSADSRGLVCTDFQSTTP